MMNFVKTVFLLSLLTLGMVAIGSLIGGTNGALIAFTIAFIMNFLSYWFSASIILRLYRAKPITEAENPPLYRMVRELSRKAGLPMPKVCIIETQVPNAFATGRNPAHGVVAVTTGIMRRLNRDELEGVIAHELSHISGRDILIGSIAATIAGAIMLLADLARYAAILGGGKNSEGNSSNIFVLILLSIIAPIAAFIVQMAISRTREYQADAGAAKLTGKPLALASALEKISVSVDETALSASPATAHIFIVNPLSGKKIFSLFSTHPATEDRIKKLREIDRSMHSIGSTYRPTNPLIR